MATATNTYPKMLTGTALNGRTVPLVYPSGVSHVKQGLFVIFNSAAEENAYDGTGVTASTVPGVIENRHHS